MAAPYHSISKLNGLKEWLSTFKQAITKYFGGEHAESLLEAVSFPGRLVMATIISHKNRSNNVVQSVR